MSSNETKVDVASLGYAHPRSLRSADAVASRLALLSEPHIAPLAGYVSRLRQERQSWEFPDFDPLDGGVDAEILFLLEKPGPMTSPQHKRKGSGFISRDNDDPTAEAIYWFMQKAGIDRKRTVLWNTIPGWNGRRAIDAGEAGAGIEEVANLLGLLPRIHTVVLVGNNAHRAQAAIRALNLRVIKSAHPGPLVRGLNRAQWERIPEQWAQATSAIEQKVVTKAPTSVDGLTAVEHRVLQVLLNNVIPDLHDRSGAKAAVVTRRHFHDSLPNLSLQAILNIVVGLVDRERRLIVRVERRDTALLVVFEANGVDAAAGAGREWQSVTNE